MQCEDTEDSFCKSSRQFSLSTNLLEHLCLTFLTFRAMRNKCYLLASPASHSLFQPEWAQAYPVSLLISKLNFNNLNMCAQMWFFNNYFSPVWVYWNLWTCELISSVNFRTISVIAFTNILFSSFLATPIIHILFFQCHSPGIWLVSFFSLTSCLLFLFDFQWGFL